MLNYITQHCFCLCTWRGKKKNKWELGFWGVTQVPALPEWMQPHYVPVKLCTMPIPSPEKGMAKDSTGGSRRPYRGLELYAAVLRLFKLLPMNALALSSRQKPGLDVIWLGQESVQVLWKEGSIKEWRGLDRRLVNQGDMSPLNKATPVNKSFNWLERLVFQERLIIYIFMWTL